MSLSCKQEKPTSQCMQQGIQLTKICKFHLPKSKNIHTMLMMGFPLNFSIPLLKLSHMLLMTVSLNVSVLNMCLAHTVVVCPFNQLYAPSSMSFISFIILSNSCAYVALAAFQNNSLIIMLGCCFLRLLYKCLQQIMCSYCGQLSTNACTNPCQENQQWLTYIHISLLVQCS